MTDHAHGCPALLAWDVPGACDCGGLQQPFGGEIWEQSRFPCFTVYVITGYGGMALSSDPRERGNCLHDTCSHDDEKLGRWWTQRELAAHLNKLDYVCCGQLYDVLLDWKYGGHFEELAKEGYKERENTRRWEGRTD